MSERMFFRATVISLLGCLLFLHLESQIRTAVPLQTVERAEPPPPAPIVVVAPDTAASTQVVDVRRSDIDRLLTGDGFARSARIVPSMRDGAPNGFKLYAIRPGSALAAIGLVNGDTVHRINDLRLDTADGAMEVYTKTRVSDHFDIELTRQGQPHRIVVLVHDSRH
jgi:type II secretory pathway component PulC